MSTVDRLREKLQGLICCYRQNGFIYTLQRTLISLHLMKDQSSPRTYSFYSRLSPDRYEEELKRWFRFYTDMDLDLENPVTYNEKIQWMKLYDATPLKTTLSDKYLVRDWVREKIGEEYLIPLLGVWDSFDEIDFDALPDRFVLKVNQGCGYNLIVQDKKTLDKKAAKRKFDYWMKRNFAYVGLEMQYLNIPPKIIAEEYLENNNENLYDYKVLCFDGKANCILYLADRKTGVHKAFFDLNWNRLPFMSTGVPIEEDVAPPKNLNLLIELAEKLSEGFPHVRVDFYILNDGSIKFGEMTFTPAAGKNVWNPPEQDRFFGDLIKLPPKSPIPAKMR